MHVKICGLTTPAAVRAAVDAGADAVGFVFAESPRRVTPEQAAELAEYVPQHVVKVAVMLHPDPEEWNAVRDVFKPDWLQTDSEDFAALDIPESIGCLPVYRDDGATDYEQADIDWPEYVVFEGARSGVGQRPDFERAAQVARKTCVVLAGGLNPGNVREAIIQVRPWAVDVSSGVETAPGVKDTGRISAFIKAAKEAEKSHAG
ncbi:MAG: phosphoribosylanthranilate isomerase [Gammaproteobacteria bacterium]|nr:phosphoribosylanthranilate isomerase [Gammaproteobacteria bacterium]NND55172.1 phosphoribosylanthranilate isomerase [Gammaproteobacteria bacterium]